MKYNILAWLSALPLLLLIPYMSISILGDEEEVFKTRKCSIEAFLPMITEGQISEEYELEAIKCQTILNRSNFYRHLELEEDFLKGIRMLWEFQSLDNWKSRSRQNMDFQKIMSFQKFQTAARDTENIVLRYEGEWKILPYHRLSNGKTRNGEEVFHDSDYAYLTAVDSGWDLEADDYEKSYYYKADTFMEKIQITSRDSSGYVLSLTFDGKPMEGESFREMKGLPSADFTIEKIGERYRFLCRGHGHGLGLSQYGANQMAKNGTDYETILNHYFPEMELECIGRE